MWAVQGQGVQRDRVICQSEDQENAWRFRWHCTCESNFFFFHDSCHVLVRLQGPVRKIMSIFAEVKLETSQQLQVVHPTHLADCNDAIMLLFELPSDPDSFMITLCTGNESPLDEIDLCLSRHVHIMD